MDKQIIIDGVQVQDCVFFCTDIQEEIICEKNLYPTCGGCKGIDCYYKQLKRKEQECERLKDENITLTVTREKLLGELCIVEEGLKDYLEHYNRQCKQLDQLKAENEHLSEKEEEAKHYLEEAEKFKNCLTEIKEIAEKGHKERGNLMRTWWFKDILQKISEVENV